MHICKTNLRRACLPYAATSAALDCIPFSQRLLHGATLTLNQLSNSYSSKGGQLKRAQIGQLRNLRLETWWKRSEGTQWEGGSQRGRKVSWMFKSLFEKFSRMQIVSKEVQPLGGQLGYHMNQPEHHSWLQRGKIKGNWFQQLFVENFNEMRILHSPAPS